MALSTELISQFVKVTKDKTETKSETIVYGTIVEHEGSKYVRIDGSDLLTPIDQTTDVVNQERVTVMIKDHRAIVTGNITSPSARTDRVEELGTKITEAEILIADKVSTKQLEATNAQIENLVADNVTITGKLEAAEANIETLQSENVTITEKLTAAEADIETLNTTKLSADIAEITYAKVESLDATNVKVNNLEATYGEFTDLTTKDLTAIKADIDELNTKKLDAETADIKYATIESLNATNANVDNLEAENADIHNLIFGSASGTTIHTSFANAVIAQLGNAQIKSAMIESVSAGQITAGDIITNNVRVMSEDGKLLISDETIQISDANRVRVQIGKDAAGDYSISIWDADGNLMFSEGGITDSAIKEAIIRNDMVSADANISASKLDISSLFTEINGSTETIDSSKIYMDAKKQTLDVAFTTMINDLDSVEGIVTSQGTQLSVVQGQIESKIWQQDITTAVDNLEIGGRNLWMNGNFAKNAQTVGDTSIWREYEIVDLEEGNPTGHNKAVHFMNGDGEAATYRFDTSTEELVGRTLTLQCWVKYENVTTGSNSWNALNIGKFTLVYTLEDGTTTAAEYPTFGPSGRTGTSDGWIFIERSKTFRDDVKAVKLGPIRIGMEFGGAGDVWVTGIKLEYGNKATDWSPAPEDVEESVDELSTKYSSLEQTIDSVSSTVAEHTTQISNKADSSEVTEVSNKITSLEQTIDSISGTIAEHTTQISNKADSSTVTEIKDEVSSLTLDLDGFKTSVSETYTTKTEFENLEIGGRNYILYGKGDEKKGFFTNFNTVENGYGECTLTSRKTYTNIDISPGFVLGCRDYEVGKKVTFSYDFMYTVYDFPEGADRNECWIGQRYTNSSTETDGTWRGVTQHGLPILGRDCELNEWIHVEKTMMIPEQAAATIGTNANIQFYNSNSDVTATITFRMKNVKLEYGIKATDWTPAPEEVEDSVDTLSAKYSSLELTIDSISGTVADHATQISNKADGSEVTELKNDVSSLTLGLDTFKTSVSETYTTKTEFKNLEIGGRNLIRNSINMIYTDYRFDYDQTAALGEALLGAMILGKE